MCVVLRGLCVVFGGLHTVFAGCICCCCGGVHWPPRGAPFACCPVTRCGGENWSFLRVSWLSVSSHLLHVTCVGRDDFAFENLFSWANASRSFSSSSYSSANSINVSRSGTLYALRKILRLGVQFSFMIFKVSLAE
ncbi:uncharacterized protein LOC127010739 [Drosophila biarmipes]|uniref:uncharacterized protein LOC127010739 n=1 Tax=Drosophila biarmipes TaxID=125945 RepID=UPI0021CC8FE0|nr:uncharacterized protein LOC127010739 [Drosophila biarmipes]